MHRVNAGYTLLARVSDGENALADLGALLATLQLPFATTTTTHFATISILPAQMYGDEELPATLMFATSYCGPILTHVKELVSVMGDELRKVFEYCEGFHSGCSNAELELFILGRVERHAVIDRERDVASLEKAHQIVEVLFRSAAG